MRAGVEKDANGEFHAADLLHAQQVLGLKKIHQENLKELKIGEPKEETLYKFYESTKGQLRAITELSEKITRA